MSSGPFDRAWVEISGAALRQNIRTIRASVGSGVALIPMVKRDAYGLGASGAVAALEPESPAAYGVATVVEGEELRSLGVRRPVVVFAPVSSASVGPALAADLTLSISDLEMLEQVREEARRTGLSAGIHVEVDTGMGRAGLPWDRAGEWGPQVSALTGGDPVRWEGCFTHFHSADAEEEGPAGNSIQLQAERFREAVAALPLPEGVLLHLGNSAAALRRPDAVGGGVRPGIFLFGGQAGVGLPAPEPAVSVRARVALVREVDPGSTVGYGATHRATGAARWATLSIGYGDGLRRALSNRGSALIRGRRVPIVGRISMDMTVVDITGLSEIRPGDVATLLGADGDERITVEEMAMQAGTINYEILTGFTPRLPRVWNPEGGP